ncbi:MAG: prepilin peptidase [endosymbiont of Galathealinum brachiosum]|uniref:Prepilin leader peptidase/N-methyltransferase n=1 Tax=endosymbiont of Galathealinum brachiosum TaxID=2200906 RepID=A0A370D9X3_9GAMM|nr:MAG: prepilin peptidase [endosymbiont of Galathealinum brachiosum]
MQNTLIEFQNNPWLFFTTVTLISLSVGSFLNVVIYRLPVMMQNEWRTDCKNFLELEPDKKTPEIFNLSKPDSSCPNCGHKIRAWENIPVISYMVLGGKCSSCKTHISIQYPVIEIVTALLSVLIAIKFGVSGETFFGLIFTWALVSLTVIDAKTQLLPDDITLPLLWLGILVNTSGLYTDLESSVFGAIAGYLILWSIYKLFKLVTGKEGMGYGDFKLLAALGAWMGWVMLPQIILLSSLVGAVIGISMIMIRKHDKGVPIPFGPYLAIAGWIAFVWGAEINQLWLNIQA